jgi:UDP-glucuronate 4-epimerase
LSCYLVTGSCGFIGAETALRLLREGHDVVGLDNLNDYYDVNLKHQRLGRLMDYENFKFFQIDISDGEELEKVFITYNPSRVIHLAAQAGVQYGLTNPGSYSKSNLIGFMNVIDISQRRNIEHFVYASSSSVYGRNSKFPFKEDMDIRTPMSLYAATKIANESIAYAYSATHGLCCTGLRFFTVYGPWGRPDMAPMIFAKSLLHGKEISLYNNGDYIRDFTYIEDVVEAITLVANHPKKSGSLLEVENGSEDAIPSQVFNVGGSNPIRVSLFLEELEKALGIVGKKVYLPSRIGDAPATHADNSLIEKITGWTSKIDLKLGIQKFAEWLMSSES